MPHLNFVVGQNSHIRSMCRMSPRKADQKEIRVTVSQEVYTLLKRIAGIKEASMNKVVVAAIDRFLEDDDTKELIDRYNLED